LTLNETADSCLSLPSASDTPQHDLMSQYDIAVSSATQYKIEVLKLMIVH